MLEGLISSKNKNCCYFSKIMPKMKNRAKIRKILQKNTNFDFFKEKIPFSSSNFENKNKWAPNQYFQNSNFEAYIKKC